MFVTIRPDTVLHRLLYEQFRLYGCTLRPLTRDWLIGMLARHHSDVLHNMTLAMVTINELVGPPCTERALTRSREGQMS